MPKIDGKWYTSVPAPGSDREGRNFPPDSELHSEPIVPTQFNRPAQQRPGDSDVPAIAEREIGLDRRSLRERLRVVDIVDVELQVQLLGYRVHRAHIELRVIRVDRDVRV